MKNAIILIALFTLIGCKKKYTCSSDILYIRPVGIAFKGFSKAELDTFFVNNYYNNGKFDSLIRKDTIITDSILLLHDTAFAPIRGLSNAFLGVNGSYNYQIMLPKAQREFKINGITANTETRSWTQDHRCSTVGSNVEPVQNILIDSVLTPCSTFPPNSNASVDYFVYLRK